MKSFITSHKALLISAVILFLLVISIASAFWAPTDNTKQANNRGGDQSNNSQNGSNTTQTSSSSAGAGGNYRTIISDYNETVRNLPDSEKLAIEKMLYQTLANNTEAPRTATDATIRAGSYQQQYDPQTTIYTTSFLVDIDSIKQSYRIRDTYPLINENREYLDYTTLVLCPTKDELKYNEFNCTDRLKIE